MRLTKENGPTQTGSVPNLSPRVCSCFGDMIIPARSASAAVSGANGSDSVRRTVVGSTTSTDSTVDSSAARADPSSSRWRSSEVLTAAASIGVPSVKVTPSRSVMVTVVPPSPTSGSSAASCGTSCRSASTS